MFDRVLFSVKPVISLFTLLRKVLTALLVFGGRLDFSFRKISVFHSFGSGSFSSSLSLKNSTLAFIFQLKNIK
jgi:hypothetical protein